eukprot:165654-Pyramimonas_sp.AAC.1
MTRAGDSRVPDTFVMKPPKACQKCTPTSVAEKSMGDLDAARVGLKLMSLSMSAARALEAHEI